MATAEEILMAAATDDIITIDSDLRTINIPPTIKLLGVESDKDVRRLHFKMPATYGDIDLSNFQIRINYLNAKSEGDVYPVTDKAVASGYITFSWLVGKFAVQYKGAVRFIVCIRDVAKDGRVLRELNTTLASLPVLEGLETDAKIVEDNPNVLESILLQLDEVKANDASRYALRIDGATATSERGLVIGQKGSNYVKVITLGEGLKLNGDKLELDIPIYNGETSEDEIIKFIIQVSTDEEHIAVSGMTFGEWVNSKYNTGGYYINSGNVVCTSEGAAVMDGSNEVSADNVIKANHQYTYAGG